MVRLVCRAPSTDPRRHNKPCGAILGDVPGPVRFVGTSPRRSHAVDGRIRLQCGRRDCRTWNIFEAIFPEPSVE